MKLIFKTTLGILYLVLFLAAPNITSAQDIVGDWSIKKLDSAFTLNKDSSIQVTENIVADCPQCVNKHGIFRVLPTRINITDGSKINTPVTLIGITDFNNTPLKYSTIKDTFNHTVTWKIGDADKTVSGINNYKITYKVDNTVRFANKDFDEFYWNINGTFWDLPINEFTSTINFPDGINKDNSQTSYYTGYQDEKRQDLASLAWLNQSSLQIKSTQELSPKQGITLSVTFPKNIISPYKPTFADGYGSFLNFIWFLIPLLVFIYCFNIWNKNGRDPKLNRTIVPEFDIPDKLSPLEIGMLESNGSINNNMISSSLIDFAVKKIMVIEEIPKQGIFGKKDYKLKLLGKIPTNLSPGETTLLNSLFKGKTEVLLSTLKNKFYVNLTTIQKVGQDDLVTRQFIAKKGLALSTGFWVVGFVMIFGSFWLGAIAKNFFLAASLIISGIIILCFAPLMKQRTKKGAETLLKIMGFRMYMKVAEKYRQQFNEKENIFERFLPYAMLFGLTELWIKKMEMLYGKDYFNTYHPYWFVGSMSNFDVGSFTSELNSISSNIGGAMSSPSGSGGSGSSGGGGGGGGGGGW